MSGEGPRSDCSAKMGCLPTLAQCNDVQLQNGQRSSTPSTYAKGIKKWNLQHASSQSEHAESMSSIGDEEIDDIDDTMVEATFTETTEAGTNCVLEVCANDGNSNANNTLATILDEFHARMGRLPSLEECNDVRVKNAARTIAPKTLCNAITEWIAKNIGTSSSLEAFIQ